jgi:predicted  nucleic acid-binding Zn-ribbon protein
MQNENTGSLDYKAEYHRLLEINEALKCKCELLNGDFEMLQRDKKSLEEQYKSLENTLADAEKEIAHLKGQVKAFEFCIAKGK